MSRREHAGALREAALLLQLELETNCYCHALPPDRRPCHNHRSAEMIGRLLRALAPEQA